MTTQRWLGLAAPVVMLAAGGGTAQAQYQTSPYSPYLNLFRGGGSLTSNYYGLVRPQLDAQASLAQLQRQIAYAQQNVSVQTIDPGVTTGVLAGFQTHRAYFGGPGVYRHFDFVSAGLPGTGVSGQQRAFTAPGLNTPGFYNTSFQGSPGQPPATQTTRPPGQ
jgi:hypothetical protein